MIAAPAVRRHGGARAALFAAAAETHERMHGLEPFRLISGGELGEDGYVRLLQGMFLFHSAVSAGAVRFGWSRLSSAKRRLDLIRDDLACLGAAPPPVRGHRLRPRGADWALGSLYAAEGSMLGGRVIARQLDYLFAERAAGRRFFRGTADDGAAWRRLLEVLEERCSEPPALSYATEGMLATFDLFERCMA